MNSTENWLLPLPITEAARQTALQFANQQPAPAKAEQVRLNTLAVWVVNDYLQLMGIPTNLTSGDSWNPISRLGADVADLEVIGVGRLECRPMGRQQETCQIPPEVHLDRIGYVFVQIDESLRQAAILGFTKRIVSEPLSLEQLQSPEDLLAHISLLRQTATTTQFAAQTGLANLSQWLQGVFEMGWETVENLLNPPQLRPAFSFRSVPFSEEVEQSSLVPKIRRGKLLDLEGQSDRVLLVVELDCEVNQSITNIRLQVYPVGEHLSLPPNLQLLVLDQSGSVVLEAQSRSADDYIQLQFRGRSREQFRVKVALGDACVTEEFVI